ncbi:MAG: acetyltransferase [Acidobacteria bacterium]|nr:acetyltransferase [Acidobacteriota bacterium]
MNASLDIDANRRARKWSSQELLTRAIWELLRGPLFAWTPRPLWSWRSAVLRFFGAYIGREVRLHPSVRIDVPFNISIGDYTAVGDRATLYALGPITIGRRVTISQGAHLCAGTHDFRRATMPLVKSRITIGDEVWICADAFVGPDVTVGERAIVGARAVAVRDVVAESIVAGNPARVVSYRTVVQA